MKQTNGKDYPFIPYGRQTVTSTDVQAVNDVLRSDYLTQGKVVPEFENQLCTLTGANYATTFNSATSALHASCLALGLAPGDIIWTSPISFVASANCGLYCGATVDFVDIDPTTGLISTQKLAKRLEIADKEGNLPKVLVPVHLAGTSCAMAEIALLANQYGFKILEDASHAIGGLYRGNQIGCGQYSDITVFSFHPVKIITTGEGGAALTNDPAIKNRLVSLRSHGIAREDFELESPGPWYYEQQELGFNYRLTDLQAALGLSQLKRLKEFLKRRHFLANRYRTELENWSVCLLDEPADCKSAYHLAVMRCPAASPAQHRSLFEGMRTARIGVQLHYWPIPLQPHYRRLGFKPGDFPLAERYANTSFSLPLFPGMTDADQDRVLACLDALLKQQGLA